MERISKPGPTPSRMQILQEKSCVSVVSPGIETTSDSYRVARSRVSDNLSRNLSS
ncbi:MAG: hypothetical protein ACK526_10510 [Planctomyces sp.]